MKKLLVAAFHPRDYDWGLRPWRRHSTVLAVAGLVYVGIGVAYLAAEPRPDGEATRTLALVLAPLEFWGAVWVITGTLALLSARWPPASETWGYSTMSGLAAWWATCYAMGIFFGGGTRAVTACLVWALVAFMWWAIAGLANPDPSLVRVIGHGHDDRD